MRDSDGNQVGVSCKSGIVTIKVGGVCLSFEGRQWMMLCAEGLSQLSRAKSGGREVEAAPPESGVTPGGIEAGDHDNAPASPEVVRVLLDEFAIAKGMGRGTYPPSGRNRDPIMARIKGGAKPSDLLRILRAAGRMYKKVWVRAPSGPYTMSVEKALDVGPDALLLEQKETTGSPLDHLSPAARSLLRKHMRS